MFCPKCGKSLNDGSRFCPGCGASLEAVTYVKESEGKASQPEKNKPLYQQGTEISKTPVKKKTSAAAIVFAAVALVLAVILILQNIGVLGLASGRRKFEGTGYNSAEEAVLAYIDAFKDGDVSAMLQTFAIETYNDNLDTEAFIEQVGSFLYNYYNYPLYDSDYERKFLIYARVGDLADSIRYQCLYSNFPEDENSTWRTFEGSGVSLKTEILQYLNKFKSYDVDQFVSSVTFVEFLDPAILVEELTDYDDYRQRIETFREQRGYYGMDEYQDIAAHITIKGEDYLLCMGCARYGEKWYNALCGDCYLSICLTSYQTSYRMGLISYDKLTES